MGFARFVNGGETDDVQSSITRSSWLLSFVPRVSRQGELRARIRQWTEYAGLAGQIECLRLSRPYEARGTAVPPAPSAILLCLHHTRC